MKRYTTRQDATSALESAGLYRQSDGTYTTHGRYDLSHGEVTRPDYYVAKYKDGWGIGVKNYYLSGTFRAPSNGSIDLDEHFNEGY